MTFNENSRVKRPDLFYFTKMDGTYLSLKAQSGTQEDMMRYPKLFAIRAIESKLSLKVKLLLKEEYPLTRAYITPLRQNHFEFKAEVNSVKPVKRFYQGLKEDVEV